MTKRKSFVVYTDLDDSLASFTDAEVGGIFRAMLTYAREGRETDLSDREAVAFGFIKAQMDRDFDKYDEIVEKRKAAVAAREEKKSKSNQMISNDIKSNQVISSATDNDTVTVTDTENENENENVNVTGIIIPPLPPTGGGACKKSFSDFWGAYPKKVAQGACRKEWERRNIDGNTAAAIIAAVERQKKTDQWRRGYIPNPLTWIREERWLDQAEPEAKADSFPQSSPFILEGAIKAAKERGTNG